MSIASPSTLLLATALASPTLLSAANGTTEVGDAALRFLICVPVAAIMLAVLRMLTRDYGPGHGGTAAPPGRRRPGRSRPGRGRTRRSSSASPPRSRDHALPRAIQIVPEP